MPNAAYSHLCLGLKCPDLGCVNPKAGEGKLKMALLSKNLRDTGKIESSTTDGFLKYTVSLDRHSTVQCKVTLSLQ